MCDLHDGRAHFPVRPGGSRCYVGRRADGGEWHHPGRWGVLALQRASSDPSSRDPYAERWHFGSRCPASEDPRPRSEVADAYVRQMAGTFFEPSFDGRQTDGSDLSPIDGSSGDVPHWLLYGSTAPEVAPSPYISRKMLADRTQSIVSVETLSLIVCLGVGSLPPPILR